ncbi:MAG: TadE/TadG family type IV pilus assembly protein [Anaerolineae bacterium]
MGRWKRFRTILRSSKGQELVEYALILPILLALLLGIMELGVAVLNYNTMSNAAREAARTGTLTRDELAIRSSGLRLTSATPLTNTDITIKWYDGGTELPYEQRAQATKLRVIVAQDYHLLTGAFLGAFGFPSAISMTATSTMTVE